MKAHLLYVIEFFATLLFAVLVSGCAGSDFRNAMINGTAGSGQGNYDIIVPPPHTVWVGVNHNGPYYIDSRGLYKPPRYCPPPRFHPEPVSSSANVTVIQNGNNNSSAVYITPAPSAQSIRGMIPGGGQQHQRSHRR